MTLYALENVDDAFDVARAFLAGLGRWAWVKLAVVVLFVGGLGGGFPGVPGFDASVGDGPTPPATDLPSFEPGPEFWVLVAGVVAVAVAAGVVLGVVGATMEFVFVESLRSEAVAVRAYWGRYWRKGVRLFAFRVAVGLLTLGTIALVGAVLVLPFLLGTGGFGPWFLLGVLVFVPVAVVLAVVSGLVGGFTTAFVVPIMILEDCGVLAGWRRLWPTIRAQWKQYVAYAVGAWVLSIAGGIVVVLLAAVGLVVLLVPFGVLFGAGAALLAVAQPVGVAVLVVAGTAFALCAVVVFALAQVPVQTYLRYYALLVLGDVESAFDAVPDQRAAVREADAA